MALLRSTVKVFFQPYIVYYSLAFLPVVELVDVLNVSKNDIVLVDEPMRDVF